MAKYGILLSNNDGSFTTTKSNFVSYDDITNYLNINELSATNFIFSGSKNAILTVSGGNFISYNAEDYPNFHMVYNDSTWKPEILNIPKGTSGGDLFGSYPNPIIKNISNVNAGTLLVERGGLSSRTQNNLLNNISQGSIIIANGTSSLAAVSTSSYDGVGDWVLGSSDGITWSAIQATAPARDIDIQTFVGANDIDGASYTWTKANSNHKWVRVLLQAGGGGGGASSWSATNPPGATGGGGGGFTDITIYIGNTTSATVNVGFGGGAGVGNGGTGTAGGASSFSVGSLYVSAQGGQGGPYNAPTGGAGGIGLTYTGGTGGDSSVVGGDSPCASGGGGGAGNGATAKNGGIAGLYSSNTQPPSGNGGYTERLFGLNTIVGFGTGGKGGSNGSTTRYNGKYGGGGGGASEGSVENSGAGGSGWVIVISY